MRSLCLRDLLGLALSCPRIRHQSPKKPVHSQHLDSNRECALVNTLHQPACSPLSVCRPHKTPWQMAEQPRIMQQKSMHRSCSSHSIRASEGPRSETLRDLLEGNGWPEIVVLIVLWECSLQQGKMGSSRLHAAKHLELALRRATRAGFMTGPSGDLVNPL